MRAAVRAQEPPGSPVLLRWPVTNSQKEVLLIDELEDIVEALSSDLFV
jgi:SpoU rRNA methylase family enzyme